MSNLASVGQGIPTPGGNYREILRARLEERCQANPRYSLRAFARDLGLAPSRVSLVLQGKQGLSQGSALKVCRRLDLSPRETERFCVLVAASDSRNKGERAAAFGKLSAAAASVDGAFRTLDEEAFRVIADWYHYAILELCKTRGFKSDAGWISRRLGISRIEAECAVERLLKLDLLARGRAGKLVPTDAVLTTTHGVPSSAIRKFQSQILEMATKAIITDPVAEKDISTLTVAIRSSRLPEVSEKITRFRRALNDELERDLAEHGADEVYTLAIQFFKVTKGTSI